MEEDRSQIKNYLRPQGKGIKLHLGCGDYWYEGYINIDIGVYGGTDMIWDIRYILPFQPEVVSNIRAYEVVEHFTRNELDKMLEDWKRLLFKGGRIEISVPDMDGLVEMYSQDKSKSIEMMYGYEEHQHHKTGYTIESLTKLFEDHYFKVLSCKKGFLPERPTEPKLILEAEK